MFDSGIPAQMLIDGIASECDVALEIPTDTWVMWLNSLEQFLYSGIIREYRRIRIMLRDVKNVNTVLDFDGYFVDLNDTSVLSDEERPRFEDLYTVYVGKNSPVQLIKAETASGRRFNNCFFKADMQLVDEGISIADMQSPNVLALRLDDETRDKFDRDGAVIVYRTRPKLKSTGPGGTISGENVMLPIEFIELAKAKLRAEAYMIENEFGTAQNWINTYNILLEDFKQWLNIDKPRFGM